ncbi:MAG TPA: lysophospholipid acyltransferase family protein [Chloroflexota bacterium]|nr:lysophospholipid acyltransferase family protein [Chloroflexota bacterium]
MARIPDRARPNRLAQASKVILGGYFKLYHRFEVIGAENLPAHPPLLGLTNHISLLDVPAFGLIDPYPNSALVAKASLLRVPIIAHILRSWGMIPVERHGQDLTAVREVLRCLREGRAVAIAAEGTRNRSGGLGEVHPVLARLAITAGVPLVAIAAIGTYQALPPGAWVPRPKPVRVAIGPVFDLGYLRDRPRAEAIEEARAIIRARLAELLPPTAKGIATAEDAEARGGKEVRAG